MNPLQNLYYMARRFKTATALNLVGLVVAFAAFYLFMTQVQYNAGYNRGIPNAERIFRVESKMNLDAPWGVNCNLPVLEKMFQLPEVESGTILPTWAQMTLDNVFGPVLKCCRPREINGLYKAKNKNPARIFYLSQWQN